MGNGEALKIARNLVKVGQVSSLNREKGTLKVLFLDKDSIVSDDIPIMMHIGMPKVGDQVLCLFFGNGLERGVCLGRFYSDKNPPASNFK